MPWEQINYQRDDEESVTWLLCDLCYDPDTIDSLTAPLGGVWGYADDDEEGDDDWEKDDLDADDFDGANRMSLRLLRGLDPDSLI